MKVHQAAIRDRNGKIHTLPRPNRHSAVIQHMFKAEGIRPSFTHDEQGFILEDGTFVSRREAARIAIEQKQCEALITPGRLTTEDLW